MILNPGGVLDPRTCGLRIPERSSHDVDESYGENVMSTFVGCGCGVEHDFSSRTSCEGPSVIYVVWPNSSRTRDDEDGKVGSSLRPKGLNLQGPKS